ncbi:MAG: hypothetical protein K1Y36_10415 [Blastocatellia bacterium]|nr:hypothetical protein [Blastocatellia bacterium]
MDQLEKILGKDPKTSMIGFATMIAVILARYGYHVEPDVIVLILTIAIVLLGRMSNEPKP